MSNFLLFLDESKNSRENPYFCLAGFIIERKIYEDELIPKVNDCKKLIGGQHIILHYTDMKKCINNFEILRTGSVRDKFWNSLCNTLKGIEFYVVGSYFDKNSYEKNFLKEYRKDAYLLTMQNIITQYSYFLHKRKSTGNIICESRNLKEDQATQKSYFNILENGTDIFLNNFISKYLTTINFHIKKDNCIGLQIADMIPITFLRHLQGKRDNYNIYKMFSDKVYDDELEQTNVFRLNK